jgi:flagellar assembly protein FliH
MSRAQRFTFDHEFGRDGVSAKKAVPLKHTLSQDEFKAVKAAAFAEGTKAAEAEAAKQAAQQLADLNAQLGALGKALDEAMRPARAEAIKLAYLIARKLAQSLVEARPQAEIEALIGQCLEQERSEPNIVIRVHDGLLDAVKAEAAKLSKERSFTGRLIVIGEPQIPAGNCTIEWANGGLERDIEKQLSAVDEIIRTYLHAEGMGGGDASHRPASPEGTHGAAAPVDGGK